MRILVSVILAVCLSACGRSTAEGPREIRVALSRDGITWVPIHLADTLGYFSEQNLKISVLDTAGLSRSMEALLGGSVDVVGGSLLQTLPLAAEGRNVRSFLLLYTRPTIVIAVAPALAGKITDIAKLKKHNVGVSAMGSPLHMQLNFVLAKHGLSPEDVYIVPIGTAASSLTALEKGRVDAAVLVGSAITSFERGNPHAVFLSDSRTVEGSRQMFGTEVFPSTSILAQDSWLRANPDTAHRFAKAVLKAMEWMRTHSAEEVRTQMPEATRMPDAEADLQAIRQAQQTLSPDGVTPDSAPQLMKEFLAVSNEKVRTATIDFTKVYTNEFVIDK